MVGIFVICSNASEKDMKMNRLAWDNGIGLTGYFVGVGLWWVMVNRSGRGYLYFIVRGEILGFMKDKLERKHLPSTYPLIKNESQGIEDDQIPS